MQNEISEKQAQTEDEGKKQYYEAMKISIQAMLILAERYVVMAEKKAAQSTGKAKERFTLMAETLRKVPANGAGNLYEAIQSFVLIWQTMTVEQTPNPFAFSVGNADRIFEPYRAMEDLDRDTTASLLKHMLVFFNVAEEDLADYSVAGCQEPLIMGKDNGNTTNSWLNLPKVLELVLQGGKSEITGTQIGKTREELGYENNLELLKNIREVFYKELDYYVDEMVKAANGASRAISLYQVPFLSAMMGGIESGIDMRDTTKQGTKYNGSGCLIHGLSKRNRRPGIGYGCIKRKLSWKPFPPGLLHSVHSSDVRILGGRNSGRQKSPRNAELWCRPAVRRCSERFWPSRKYAPGGVYIVRIHGTFVIFLDLSPEIQEDIIKRLDPASTELSA